MTKDGERYFQNETIYGVTESHFCTGIMIGHWAVPPGSTIEKEKVNMGISVVVPADKILEVLNQPDLVEMRRAQEALL
jgi:hypothetical protein